MSIRVPFSAGVVLVVGIFVMMFEYDSVVGDASRVPKKVYTRDGGARSIRDEEGTFQRPRVNPKASVDDAC
jgi:hypothetical protein